MKDKLNDPRCRNAKPKERAYRLADGGGLALLVKPNGQKLWHYRFRLAGKGLTYALGIYPGVTLKDARKEHDHARKLVAAGISPVQHRRAQREHQEAERKAKAAEKADTVAVLVRDWLAYVRRHGSQKTGRAWSTARSDRVDNFLKRHLLPALGHIPLRNLTAKDVRTALEKVAARHVYTARLCKQWLRAAIRWAEERDRIKHDPTQKAALPAHKHSHKTPLDPRDIAALWADLGRYGAKDTAIGLRLLLLLFVRPSELREARWSEIDGATWRIPAERTKMRTPHVVPLSAESQELLGELRQISGDTPFLFPGVKRDKPITAQAWQGAIGAIGWDGRFTPHAARATASTLLRELGYSADWIDTQLGHQQRDEVRASYDFAQYLPQRREMMQRWSAYVTGLGQGKVEALKRKTAAEEKAA